MLYKRCEIAEGPAEGSLICTAMTVASQSQHRTVGAGSCLATSVREDTCSPLDIDADKEDEGCEDEPDNDPWRHSGRIHLESSGNNTRTQDLALQEIGVLQVQFALQQLLPTNDHGVRHVGLRADFELDFGLVRILRRFCAADQVQGVGPHFHRSSNSRSHVFPHELRFSHVHHHYHVDSVVVLLRDRRVADLPVVDRRVPRFALTSEVKRPDGLAGAADAARVGTGLAGVTARRAGPTAINSSLVAILDSIRAGGSARQSIHLALAERDGGFRRRTQRLIKHTAEITPHLDPSAVLRVPVVPQV
mmetsp:Transcript_99576/g.167929  ORF Transcript_99576/g.167929 Transcript_99576/m.167929 type:complete len:305 (-) Transcript_99576:644-1558(-)